MWKPSAGAWEAGAEGERRVAQALTALPPEWLVLHDRLLMPGRSEANLDHVVVGPAGVFLIDSKNWAGRISEYQGSVFKHAGGPDGQRRHVPLDHQFDGAFRMATEMARRIQVGVTVVIALSGSQGAAFGEPRVVRSVWVVPMARLEAWLQSRPPAGIPDVDRLGVLVRTEFPSTTTDWQLLAAMGRELDRQSQPIATAPRRRPSSRPPKKAANPRRKRDGLRRPLVTLVALALMWWAITQGALESAVNGAFGVVTNAITDAVALPPSAAPDRLSCTDVDLASTGLDAAAKAVSTPKPLGCDWHVPAEDGSVVLVLRLRELTGPSEAVNPMLARSDDLVSPEVVTQDALGGEATYLWVRAGIPLAAAKDAPVASRSMHVFVAHEFLGLTPKEGRQLAARITDSVSARHPQ